GRAVRLVPAAVGAFECPGPAEVVLGTGPADGGELLVAVEVELDLPLSPPAGVVRLPGQVGAHVVALAAHVIDDGVRLAVGQRVGPAPLRMQVPTCGWQLGEAVGDLVEAPLDGALAGVLDGDACPGPERHLPIGVQPTG